MPNALARTSSPYLRQHADNPVDWLPWGEDAFARARAENKPIFLSIGYATCHWCHVMAHESFESTCIAELLNRDFISIKVDREERPDVDRVYMTYVQALTGRGGWPLSVFLSPELKPFYGGTYFPPEDFQGRPGFATLLKSITHAWQTRREELVQEGRRITAVLSGSGAEKFTNPAEALGKPNAAHAQAESDIQSFTSGGASSPRDLLPLLEQSWSTAWAWYNESYDAANGGFGGAPKFPQPGNLFFLLRFSLANEQAAVRAEGLRILTHTLAQMARGGVHDHVGGGFHRYSVDESWFVPHFEKMLYDQAQLASLCLETWQATADPRLGWLARDILTYVLRDLRHPSGAFCAAEDADSPVDRSPGATRREGAFYVWRASELRELLGDDHALAVSLFSIQEEGNVPPALDPHSELTDRNILHQAAPLDVVAKAAGLDPALVGAARLRILETLRLARGRRPRPLLDDKVLASWNGLMISALARASLCSAPAFDSAWEELPLTGAFSVDGCIPASREEPLTEHLAQNVPTPSGPAEGKGGKSSTKEVYPEKGYDLCLASARAAAAALRTLLWDPSTGRLHRSWCAEVRGPLAVAEDYACLIQGLLDLYEASFETTWLDFALELQATLDALFRDPVDGSYFSSSTEAGDLILRLKDEYDGAEPAPAGVIAKNLLRLAALLDRDDFRLNAEALLAALEPRLSAAPHALPNVLCALEWAAAWPPRLTVFAASHANPSLRSAARAAFRSPGPPSVQLAVGPAGFGASLTLGRPWLAEIASRCTDTTLLAYSCEGTSCSAPTVPELLP